MASEVNYPQCGHLFPHTVPYVFVNEQAELIHVNEQLSSLDRHIAELNTLRSTLHRRTLQLHNLLSPIRTLPIEILSYIFQLVVNPESYDRPNFGIYQECLDRALVLSSVTSQFRHIAFGTPGLWNRILLRIVEEDPIGKVSSLLQHCIARASSVSICVIERHKESGSDFRSVIETLLTSDTTRKVKAFDLFTLDHLSSWISKLNSSSLPMVESLKIRSGAGIQHLSGFDFAALNNLTRLDLDGAWMNVSIIVPPSVRYLNIYKVSHRMLVLLLYQCPNLVECAAYTIKWLDGPPFTEPLILNHLKRLDTGAINAITTELSLQHLQLPSLESLELDHVTERRSFGIQISLCCNVSATLTSLTIHTESRMFDYDELYQLCRSTFPKLRVLKLNSEFFAPLVSIIRALSPLDAECNNPRPLHLPALRSITLHSDVTKVKPRNLLDLLKNWWTDESLHLHFELPSNLHHYENWTPALTEELRSIVGSRQIEITWGCDKI